MEEVYTEDALLALVNASVACRGVVERVPGFNSKFYYYVKLDEQWSALAQQLVATVQRLKQYEDKTQRSTHKLRQLIKERYELTPEQQATLQSDKQFFVPPNPEGPHISVDEYELQAPVEFRVTRVLRYENQRMGSASDFDARSFSSEWFAFKVEFTGAHVPPTPSSPHVSICNAGFAFPEAPKEKRQGKQKKK